MDAIEYMKTLRRSERAKIAEAAGYKPAYVNKLISIGNRPAPIGLALQCVKHSFGKVDFWQSIDPSLRDGIDWDLLGEVIQSQTRH